MSVEKYDVVIIGAGLGGLTTAGYLAKQGKSVLVLEPWMVSRPEAGLTPSCTISKCLRKYPSSGLTPSTP